MKERNIFRILLVAWSFYGLISCKQANHSFTGDGTETESQESSGNEPTPPLPVDSEIPPTELPIVSQVPPDVPASCAAFLLQPPVIDYTATEDRDFIGITGVHVVSQALRNTVVATASGSIDIRSAITATINANTGQVRINADTIQSAKMGSGELCIRANHIGIADANMTSGAQVLAAKTIDVVHLGSGAFHIYRATVQKLDRLPSGKQGYPGQICLHDGAKILDFGQFNSNVARSDCN